MPHKGRARRGRRIWKQTSIVSIQGGFSAGPCHIYLGSLNSGSETVRTVWGAGAVTLPEGFQTRTPWTVTQKYTSWRGFSQETFTKKK